MFGMTLLLLRILVSAFLAILFLQSGIDKIIDRQGNLQWLSGHFAKSPLARMVPIMFGVLTIIEVAAGTLSGIGFLALLVAHNSTIAFYRAIVLAIASLCLFFAQGIEKEYAGAPILVPYLLERLLELARLAP